MTKRMSLECMAVGLMLAGLGLLSSCAQFLGPRTVEISQTELQQMLARQFPRRSRYADLLDVAVSVPRLTFDTQANRLGTEFDVTATERLFNREFKGTMALNVGFRYEPKDRTIRMTDVHLDRLQLDSLPPALAPHVTVLGNLLAVQWLNDQPVHTFKADDLKTANTFGYEPGAISVTASGLRLALNPVQQR